MKKGFAVASLWILLLLLAACTQSSIPEGYTPSKHKAPPSSAAVSMYVKEEDALSVDSVTLVFRNNAGADYSFGQDYTIEQRINGIWYTVPVMEEQGILDVAYNVRPNSTIEIANCTFIKEKYGLLDSGTYRVVKRMSDQSRFHEDFYIFAEFQVM
ncbi:immunoglobulin-like domain-containing protein [Candidatus Soleaferrea massiliensis]|uniref:immunoglobulin-like domain-containing protein n=1 Tax=Candidatus Soleaferrea massiliensis TaxID=1470354 RepID=UPI00058C5357|nr:immunoglobulin-like domain-containing protein [Candidatus Soleaferrea massiliensis]